MKTTHLELHSAYTLLGSTVRLPELVERALADGVTRLVLTDHEVLYGAIEFERICKQVGIVPIMGMTVSLPLLEQESEAHLVLLAQNRAGYRSLCRISSQIQLGETVSWEMLRASQEGLFCIDGGLRGGVVRLWETDKSAVSHYLSYFAGLWGENGYVGLEVHSEADSERAAQIQSSSARFGLQTVALQPLYNLEPEQKTQLRLLKAIDLNEPIFTITDAMLPHGERSDVNYHWLSPEELNAQFGAFPEAVAAIDGILSRCEPSLPDGSVIWPKMDLPEGKRADAQLALVTNGRLSQLYDDEHLYAVQQRLNKELAAIKRHGFAPLFLIVADIVRFARETGVPVSTRGSVANSLVAFAVGITTVDPIEHDLLFERFLNPARTSLPDIDLDFCSRRRDEVLNYVRDTYGADKVALVATVNKLKVRSAVRATAKAYGLDKVGQDFLAEQVPRGWHPDPRRRTRHSLEDLAALPENSDYRHVLLAAAHIVDLPDHLSVHPGGVVITPSSLTDFVPIQTSPKGFFITQFDHHDVETLGLPKIDLLGIRALTVLAETADLVRKYHDPDFRVADIVLEDEKTADSLSRGDTIGVFQCESSGARRTLRKLKARNIKDLAVANAFFKPGPATGGMANAFVRRYRGEQQVSYLHPALEPILGRTKGILLFQEQVLRVVTEIAGLDWQQANQVRKGMSKFQAKALNDLQNAFIQGCQRPDGPKLNEQQAKTLWQQVQAFAGYGFNQGHATAYADVSYRSAFLRTHFPALFLCARLTHAGGFHSQIVYIAEARRLGVQVNPPHVNFSQRHFSLKLLTSEVNNFTLWMGLGQVKSLRRNSVEAIVDNLPYESLADLLDKVPLQKKEIEHLIMCGALDGLGKNRATLLAEAKRAPKPPAAGQMTFDFTVPVDKSLGEVVVADSLEDRFHWERSLLGVPLTVSPLELVDLPDDHVALGQLKAHKGQPMKFYAFRLPGWTGTDGSIWLSDSDTFLMCRLKEKQRSPKSWNVVLETGRYIEDEFGTGWVEIL